ncbi:TPA: hypothetical protein ACOEQZ_001283 [Stenotrophomonas maltophilia]
MSGHYRLTTKPYASLGRATHRITSPGGIVCAEVHGDELLPHAQRLLADLNGVPNPSASPSASEADTSPVSIRGVLQAMLNGMAKAHGADAPATQLVRNAIADADRLALAAEQAKAYLASNGSGPAREKAYRDLHGALPSYRGAL